MPLELLGALFAIGAAFVGALVYLGYQAQRKTPLFATIAILFPIIAAWRSGWQAALLVLAFEGFIVVTARAEDTPLPRVSSRHDREPDVVHALTYRDAPAEAAKTRRSRPFAGSVVVLVASTVVALVSFISLLLLAALRP